MSKIKVGFIGYGKSVNRYHLPFIDMLREKMEVIGYYEKGESNFKEFYELPNVINKFENTKDLYKRVDLVIINTPAKFHYAYVKEALLAGKNVVCEKPISNSLEELEELYKIANQNKLFLTPYQNRRFDSDFLTVINAIKTEDIGKVHEIETSHEQYRKDPIYSKGDKYDGAVMGHAVHFVDQIVSEFGEPEDVIYDRANLGWKTLSGEDCPADDYYDIKLIYSDFRVRLKYSRLVVKTQPRWIVNASKGTIEHFPIDSQETDLKELKFPMTYEEFGKSSNKEDTILYLHGENKKTNIKYLDSVYLGYQEFYRKLCDHLNGEGEPPVSEKEAKTVINILTTIIENKKYKKIA